MTINYHTFF